MVMESHGKFMKKNLQRLWELCMEYGACRGSREELLPLGKN